MLILLNQPASGSLDVTTSEALSLLELVTAAVNFVDAQTESVSLADTTGAGYRLSLAELVALAESQSAGLLIPRAHAETMVVADTLSATTIGGASAMTESIVFADSCFAAIVAKAAIRAAIDSSRIVAIQRARPSVVQAGRPRN